VLCQKLTGSLSKAAITTRFAAEIKYNYAGYGKFAQDYDSICMAELPDLVNTQSDEEFNRQTATFSQSAE